MGLASTIVRGYVSINKLIRNKPLHGHSSHKEMLLSSRKQQANDVHNVRVWT